MKISELKNPASLQTIAEFLQQEKKDKAEQDKALMSIEQKRYDDFVAKFSSGGYPHLRFGQAFYNEFTLHKLSDQGRLGNLYNVRERKEAEELIFSNFEFA